MINESPGKNSGMESIGKVLHSSVMCLYHKGHEIAL